MPTRPFYHEGSRLLQDAFDSRRIADRLEQIVVRSEFTDNDRAFIDQCPMFFLATADADGWPDCSYKGGMPGFVRVTGASTLAWPDYDGNGMFRSLGNLQVNPKVGLLFLDLTHPRRLRVSGTATFVQADPLLAEHPGANGVVRVTAERIFPNCPRYVHGWEQVATSEHAPRPDHEPPTPGWKNNPDFRDHLPKRRGD